METLTIQHQTTYRYREKVSFGPHRLMLRPRESRNLRLINHHLSIEPLPTVKWANDVFGNTVAMAQFQEASDTLIIASTSELELEGEQWPVFEVTAAAARFPFLLTDDDVTDLGALRLQGYLDTSGQVRTWAQGYVAGNPTDTLSLLKDVCAGITAGFVYEERADEGVQSPEETLDRKIGSCRDFAVLFMETVRSLGFGARIVSGYLYDANQEILGSSGSGSTHAWAEVFVPGAGWITFDPTNRSVGGYNLIPVAVARDISQADPISGTFAGPNDVFEGMDISVQVAPSD